MAAPVSNDLLPRPGQAGSGDDPTSRHGALRVVLLEDDDIDADVIVRQLTKAWPSGVEIRRATRLTELEAELAKPAADPAADIVFCDLSVPDGHGIDLLERAVAAAGPVPLIVLTAADTALAGKALERGAQDYLSKGAFDAETLARALRHSMARSRSDEALRRAAADLQAANAELEECLEIMAHDLRGPLRTGRLFAERLVAATRAGEDGEPIATALIDALARMDTMVERLQLLATLRGDRPRPDLHPLAEVVREVEAELKDELAAAGGRFSVDADGPVLIDRALFRDLLRELAINSIKYRSPDRPLVVHFAVQTGATTSLVTVRDNGIGVPREYQDRVFRLFEQVDIDPASADDVGRGSGANGLGFGLACCRRIVELHRGTIALASPPDGIGVEGRVVLPVDPQA